MKRSCYISIIIYITVSKYHKTGSFPGTFQLISKQVSQKLYPVTIEMQILTKLLRSVEWLKCLNAWKQNEAPNLICLSMRESSSSTVVVNITPLALMQFILPCCSSIRSTLWFKLIWHMAVCIFRVLTDAWEAWEANLYSQYSLFTSLSTQHSLTKKPVL